MPEGSPPIVDQPSDPHLPFYDDGFRADLCELSRSVQQDWQRWAEQAVVIARLAAQVPAELGITKTPTAWKSFIREIAVARRCSDQAAGKEVFLAVCLVRSCPTVLALLQAGRLPAYNARVLLEECASCGADVVAAVDAELAERACQLSPSRVRDAVRKIELRCDADAAAVRSARATADRGARLQPGQDDQATLMLTGPALPLVQFFEAVTAAARAAKAAGDPRGIDALRFDLAVDLPQAPAAEPDPASVQPSTDGDGRTGSGLPEWAGDRRRVRPVQVLLHLPVTTALGLDNEPGWLAGYGWVSAPQCRQWLTIAELRQVCVDNSGVVVDSADRVVRPGPTPQGVRDAVLAMVANPGEITDKTYRTEPRHDPSDGLSRFVELRDRYCDGPSGTRVPAARCDLDHEARYPDGPTAAWNLVARGGRTHLLKHNGWTPLRTAGSTLWFSPGGQVVDVPHHNESPPDIDAESQLPDPDELHAVDAEFLRPPTPDDDPPWSEPPPF